MRPTAYLATGLVLVLLDVALYMLPIAPGDRAPLAAFILPIAVAALAKAGIDQSNERQAQQQGEVLKVIQHQTNGVLAQKIEDGVRKVLSERDAAQTVAVVTGSGTPAAPTPEG